MARHCTRVKQNKVGEASLAVVISWACEDIHPIPGHLKNAYTVRPNEFWLHDADEQQVESKVERPNEESRMGRHEDTRRVNQEHLRGEGTPSTDKTRATC